MSDYVSPNYTKKQLTLQNVNAYCHIHDISCHCKQPLQHIIKQIITQEPTIKPWLATITEEDGAGPTDADTEPFGPGELDLLFAKDDEDTAG